MSIVHVCTESIRLENAHVQMQLMRSADRWDGPVVSTRPDGAWTAVARSESLLLLRGSGYNGLSPLFAENVCVLADTDELGVIEASGSDGDWSYRVVFSLTAGARAIDGQAYFKTQVSQAGWLCCPLCVPKDTDCWAYPWVMADRLTVPTNIGRSIGVSRANQIWAKLAGVPAIVWRNPSGFGLLGIPQHVNYEHASLVYNPEFEGGKRLSLGYGLATGDQAEDGNEEYRAGREYSFSFQILAGLEGFEALAIEWARANRFTFDTCPKHSTDELTKRVAAGRRPEVHQDLARYVCGQWNDGRVVSGYRSGSDDSRIIIPYLPRNACIDFGLFVRTGDAVWRDRAREQMGFWLQCQHEAGWFLENWDIQRRTFFFQGFDEFGVRPDFCALSCEYAMKLVRQMAAHGEPADPAWRGAVERCLEWLTSLVEPDGAIPMTYIPAPQLLAAVNTHSAGNISDTAGYRDPTQSRHNRPSPQTRLLVAFLELERMLDVPGLRGVRLAHEAWVIAHAYERQCWWGHWNDTGHTATVFSALKFVEYCVRAHELTGEERYLEMATETASWAFFQHVPKQLEWCRQYTRGAMIEQDNYMQYGNDVGDNQIFQALLKLGRFTGRRFFTGMGRQSITTAQMSFCDDPRHPWYGSWGTYVADSTGLTVPFDTDPVNGVATHYNNWPGILDLWAVEELEADK